MRGAALRSWTGALLAAVWLAAAGGTAAAIDVAPQDSTAALADDIAAALAAARDLAPVFALPADTVARTTACDAAAQALSRCDPDPACHAALVALYGALVHAGDGVDDADVQSRRALARARTELAEVVPRLGAALDEMRAGRCGAVAPPGAHAARLRLDADGRTARVSPLVALRAGRRWALVLEGVSPEVRAALAATAVPRSVDGRTVVPEGSLAAPLERFLAEAPPRIDAARARATLAAAEEAAAELPGMPALAVVQVTFPEGVTAEQLGALRASFVDARRAPADAVATFATTDAHAGLLAYRARIAELPCPEQAAAPLDPLPVFGVTPAWLGALFDGTYRSLDPTGGAGVERILGVDAAAARPVELPYALALPRGFSADTPVVIAVDGHMGSAVRGLRHHAEGVLGRGLALLALELPEHGERDTPDGEFADRFDPLSVSANLRRSAIDVMAMVHALRDCGLVLPGGTRYRPSHLAYVGYSLGAMVGVLARGVEERLGAMVLIAGAGDFPSWLMLQLVPRLGPDLLSCVGGPEHGASCFPKGRCAPPGRCNVDPSLFWLTEGLRPAYTLLSAGADPLDFAGRRTGPASDAPLLLLTGGNDIILYPLLATRLSDAYGMRPIGPGVRRGPRSTRLHFPHLGHEMINDPAVKRVAYDFLADGGRHPPAALPGAPAAAPGAE